MKPIALNHRDIALPTKRAKPFNHPDWMFELKHDGFRVLLIKQDAFTRIWTRRGNDLASVFPEITAQLAKLPNAVIDGELVMLDAHGKPEFHRLRGRCAMRGELRIQQAARTNPAALFGFDLLTLEGKDMRGMPLRKRKLRLQRLLKHSSRICYCQHIGENGERLFPEADRLGLEGIIAKKANSPYPRGRTVNWVKVKTQRAKWNE